MKIISIIRWLLVQLLYGVVILLSYVIYPLVYVLRKPLRKLPKWLSFPLWIFLNDETDYGETVENWWFNYNNGRLDTFWQRFRIAYLWSVVRNPAWNFHSVVKPKEGDIQIVSYKGKLTKNDIEQDVWRMAGLVYEDENGNWAGNKGKYLSYKYSTFGKMVFWYRVKNKLYWRFSYAKHVEWLNRWVEIHLGTTDSTISNFPRYTIRFKIKNVELKK